MRRWLKLPLLVNAVLIALGAMAVGGRAAIQIAPTPTPQTIVMPGETRTLVSVKTVKRVVRGRVIHRSEKVYVLVPLLIVHTDHHTIRVPAHRLPLRSAAATFANPLVTVYIPISSTVFVPTTVTSTVTTTELVPTTITIPLTESGGPIS